MAKRLATRYVKTCLQLNETELMLFLSVLHDHEIIPKVKVLEDGSQEFVIEEATAETGVTITFERINHHFVMSGSFYMLSAKLAELLRQAIIRFKGDAVVHRIYANFTMEYHYRNGTVVKIVELGAAQARVIYEYRNSLEKLNQLYHRDDVEREITKLRDEINRLLDRRNVAHDANHVAEIDMQLNIRARRWFILEA